MAIKLTVLGSGVVEMSKFVDFPDGNLFIGEAKKEIPFDIKRVYYINALENKLAVRGKHAHKELSQVIFCINGSFTLLLDDGKSKQELVLDDPSLGVILGPWLWHEMSRFSKDCVILVLASDVYKADDYVRNYEEFITTVAN